MVFLEMYLSIADGNVKVFIRLDCLCYATLSMFKLTFDFYDGLTMALAV